MDSKKIKEMHAGCSIRKLKKDQLLILFLTGVLLVVIALPSGGERPARTQMIRTARSGTPRRILPGKIRWIMSGIWNRSWRR